MSFKQTFVIIPLLLFTLNFCVTPLFAEEGMFPLSELHKLNLKAMGFKLDSKQIYNPNGISLIDGIINLSGCTASFVSAEGLILTNYHCAFHAIQGVTTTDRDFMKTGFMAMNQTEEIPAKGYTVRLIDSYRDVSKEVLSVLNSKMSYEQRTKKIEKKMKQIVLQTEKRSPGKRAEVAEMFLGKTYVLFVYQYIRDVRLVYAPPRSIGEYGGEIDNWMWPRHTGDFTFMRAYVSPDGKSADYSKNNIPYRPKKYLRVSQKGVDEGDFVFILGYPGRTYRNRTAKYYTFEERQRKPFMISLFGFIIDVLEAAGRESRENEIKVSPMVKSLWNAKKKYMGQLKAFKRINLTGIKKEEELQLQAYIDSDIRLKKKYGSLLREIDKLYDSESRNFELNSLLRFLKYRNIVFGNAYWVYKASIERLKRDDERDSSFMNRNYSRTVRKMVRNLKNYTAAAEKKIFRTLLGRIVSKADKSFVDSLKRIIEYRKKDTLSLYLDRLVDHIYQTDQFKKEIHFSKMLKKKRRYFDAQESPLFKLVRIVYHLDQEQKSFSKAQKGKLDKLSAKLLQIRQQFKSTHFIPDANSTLRMTYGSVRAYSPADGIEYAAFTTLSGLIEKNTASPPFDATEKLIRLYRKRIFGNYLHPRLNDVPVNILYNTDTTGGNSGSPVLNERGELIGLNFDRVFEATINDYGWSESFSRSIGVDIRYILWFTEIYGGGEHLIQEINRVL